MNSLSQYNNEDDDSIEEIAPFRSRTATNKNDEEEDLYEASKKNIKKKDPIRKPSSKKLTDNPKNSTTSSSLSTSANSSTFLNSSTSMSKFSASTQSLIASLKGPNSTQSLIASLKGTKSSTTKNILVSSGNITPMQNSQSVVADTYVGMDTSNSVVSNSGCTFDYDSIRDIESLEQDPDQTCLSNQDHEYVIGQFHESQHDIELATDELVTDGVVDGNNDDTYDIKWINSIPKNYDERDEILEIVQVSLC